MALFGPKSKEYGDLNRKSIGELNTTVDEQEKELQTPFAGSDPGLVPTSDETTQAKYLRGDGQWGTPAGGGGGTEDYEDLANKPAIDGTELSKNSTAEGLGLAKTTDLPDLTDYAKKTDIPAVPTKTSDLQNDSGFLTSETDPTVPSWAKAQNPPTPETYSGSTPGLVPAAGSGNTGKYLKNDGTWDTPSGGGTTDYSDLTNKPAIDGTALDKNSTAEGLGLAKKSEIPDVSGFLTSETDPTVPSWAKQQNPPTPYVEVSGTLTAGQTSVTLSDASITASSTIDIYTDGDVDYVSATPGTGSITITFEEQQADLGVKVRVS